jgi:large subunit ribosomal protein L7Ae
VQVAAAPLAVKKMEQKRVVNPLFEKRAKNFGIGQVGPYFHASFPHLV